MANLIIKPTSGGSLILQDEGGTAANTIDASGNTQLAGTLGVTGNATLSGTANNLGTVTAGTFNSVIGTSATGHGLTTHFQQYYLTSNFTGTSNEISGWTEDESYKPTGVTMSESSGKWTFPTTGYWLIQAQAQSAHNADNHYYELSIKTTTNDSSWSRNRYGYAWNKSSSGTNYLTSSTFRLFDVTSTSTHKVALSIISQYSSAVTNSGNTATIITFNRIGDT